MTSVTASSRKCDIWYALCAADWTCARLREEAECAQREATQARAVAAAYQAAYDALSAEVEARVLAAKAAASEQIATLSHALSDRDKKLKEALDHRCRYLHLFKTHKLCKGKRKGKGASTSGPAVTTRRVTVLGWRKQ